MDGFNWVDELNAEVHYLRFKAMESCQLSESGEVITFTYPGLLGGEQIALFKSDFESAIGNASPDMEVWEMLLQVHNLQAT